MPVGQNHIGNIIRQNNIVTGTYTDDSIGGSVPTGTVIYSNVFARISANKPTMALLEQGLEIPELFIGMLSPGNMAVQVNDQFQITAPTNSPYFNEIFRIIGIQHTSFNDSRSYLRVQMRRLEYANSNVLQ